MSYFSPDPYNQPEAFGLTLIDSIDLDAYVYQFDMVCVWWHEDGSIYYAHDSGCSCPSPFENISSMDDLTRLEGGWAALDAYLVGLNGSTRSYAADCAEVVNKVRELTRG